MRRVPGVKWLSGFHRPEPYGPVIEEVPENLPPLSNYLDPADSGKKGGDYHRPQYGVMDFRVT